MATARNRSDSLSASPTLTPWLAEHIGWKVSLGVAAVIEVMGGLLWLLVKTGDGLRKDDNSP